MTEELNANKLIEKPAKALNRPTFGSANLDSDDLAWVSDGQGFWYKSLFEDSESGERTLLMKIDPGAYTPVHSHQELEQIYVLEGTFYDQENNYRAGDYIVRAPGADHSTGSTDGAITLLIYSEASQVKESD